MQITILSNKHPRGLKSMGSLTRLAVNQRMFLNYFNALSFERQVQCNLEVIDSVQQDLLSQRIHKSRGPDTTARPSLTMQQNISCGEYETCTLKSINMSTRLDWRQKIRSLI